MRKALALTMTVMLFIMFILPAAVLAKPDQTKKEPKGKYKVNQKLEKQVKEILKSYQKHSFAGRFKDVNRHWAAPAIERMGLIGLFNGYPDGTFKPDSEITQAEIVALVIRIIEDDEDDVADLSDLYVPNTPDWAKKPVGKAAKKGFINLNRFHSHVQASRAQAVVLIAKALGLTPADTSIIPFKDGILISRDDLGYIIAMYNEGIIIGDPDGKFNPNSALTRAQIATILDRILDRIFDSETPSESSFEVEVSPDKVTLKQGESAALNVVVTNPANPAEKTVSWSSSDPEIATVSNGVVTASDTKTGEAYITASVTSGGVTKRDRCRVTVVKDDSKITEGNFGFTGNIGTSDGKVYQEYEFIVGDSVIDLSSNNVSRIKVLEPGAAAYKDLTPNTDTTLWFNVEKVSGDYRFQVIEKDQDIHTGTLEWTAPTSVPAVKTGDELISNGLLLVEYQLGNLNLSRFTKMYQIKPDGKVQELTANEENLWFPVTNQVEGEHTFLIKKDGRWYKSIINHKPASVITAEFRFTNQIGTNDGKVYQEYALAANGTRINLSRDNIKSIKVLEPGADAQTELTPNSDATLWFNVQKATGDYVFEIIDKNDQKYTATLNWTAPTPVNALATGRERITEGLTYVEYQIGELNLSRFTKMYQILPNNRVQELTANADPNLWFKVTDQVEGKHTFLVKKDGRWYSSFINHPQW
jgi:hypothetical protein